MHLKRYQWFASDQMVLNSQVFKCQCFLVKNKISTTTSEDYRHCYVKKLKHSQYFDAELTSVQKESCGCQNSA